MVDSRRVSHRWLVFALLLTLPLIRMLLRADYGFFHIEVAIALTAAAAAALLPALISRARWQFHLSIALIIVTTSANALQNDLLPEFRLRWILATLLIGTAAAIYFFREKFATIILVFLAGSFLVDLSSSIFKRASAPSTSFAATGVPRHHVIHIIFDEMLGIGAMPADCASCVSAAREIEEILVRHKFRIFPNAYSNYRETRDSIPSILNDRLLERTAMYFPPGKSGTPYLRENSYFDRYLARNYAIRAYQSDYIVYSSPKYPSVVARTYEANALQALHSLDIDWSARLRQILVIYLRSDLFWWDIWTHVTPARLHFEHLMVGPLALQEVWPSGILQDVRAATQNTLFFAHLLTPHYPYVYRNDGSVRRPEEWRTQNRLEFEDTDAEAYRNRYELYGDQVRFLSRQIGDLLDGLKSLGQLESSTIILHGDHGSRLRLLNSSERKGRAMLATTPYAHRNNQYDYVSEPPERDLLNRFATLLAIKQPHADSPEIVTEKSSVLRFLRKYGISEGDPDEPGINSAYLFDAKGTPREIPMTRIWRSGL